MALYGELAESLTDAALARDYWLRIAGIDDRLGDVDEAAQAYYKVLAIDPGDAEALAALEQLFTRTQRWKDLIGVVERRIEQTQRRQGPRGALRHRWRRSTTSASVAPTTPSPPTRRCSRSTRAASARSRPSTASSRARRCGASSRRTSRRSSRWRPSDEAQLALMLRLAALREGEMGLVDVAIEGYRQVLERAPTNAQALAALERLGKDPKHELTIADLLEPLYRHIGDWQKLVGVHEVQVRRSEDVTRRVELLHQIAQLYEDAAADLGSRLRHAGARPPGGPGQRGDAAAARSRRARHGTLRRSRPRLPGARRRRSTTRRWPARST